MKTKEQAEELSREMIGIGNLANKETVCIITNMDEPLGYAIGNSLEVIEAINFLKGNMPEDLKQVVLELGAFMIKLAGKGENLETNKEKMLENIEKGKGYEKFLQMVENQGGDISYIKDTNKFPKAKYIEKVYSDSSGFIKSMNAKEIGEIVCDLGAGRITKEDDIDHSVGIVLNKKVSEDIKSGEEIATIYANSEEKLKEAKNKLIDIIQITKEKVEKPKMILENIFDL